VVEQPKLMAYVNNAEFSGQYNNNTGLVFKSDRPISVPPLTTRYHDEMLRLLLDESNPVLNYPNKITS